MTAAGNLLCAIQAAQGSHTETTAALAQIEGALQNAQGAFAASGGNDKIALLNAITEKYNLARGAAQEAANAIDEMMQLAGVVAEGQAGLVPTAGGGTIIHPASRPASKDPPRQPSGTPPAQPLNPVADRREFFGAALTPQGVRELLSQLPKKEEGDGNRTDGFWVDKDGSTQRVTSGMGEKEGGEYLDLDYQKAVNYWRVVAKDVVGEKFMNMWNLNEASHAEIKSLINMRAKKIRHGAIVINHASGPCEGHVTKCKELMEHYLPKGSTVGVYWPGGNYMIVKGKA